MSQTSRGVDNWTKTIWNYIKSLASQKLFEDSLLDTKNLETPTMTLDTHMVAKSFTNILVHLGKIWGTPLAHVVQHALEGPNDDDIEDKNKDPPLFGDLGSPYFSIDNELIARAPILCHDLTHRQLLQALKPSRVMGLLSPVSQPIWSWFTMPSTLVGAPAGGVT
jgi:hypothetical protein